MKPAKALLTSLFLITSLFVLASLEPVNAVSCSDTISSNSLAMGVGNCEFLYSKDGHDGPLTVSSGTLIVGGSVQNQELSLEKLVLNGGAVTIYEGAKLRLGMKMWVLDRDADGYPDNRGVVLIQADQPSTSYARVKDIKTNPVTNDCDDFNPIVHSYNHGESLTFKTTAINDATYGLGTSAKNGTFDYNCDSGITKQYTSATAYSCVATGCADHYFTATSGWADGSNAACGTTESYYTVSYVGTCHTSNYDACPYTASSLTQGCY